MQPDLVGSRTLAATGIVILAMQCFYPSLLGAIWAGENAAWAILLLGSLFAVALLWPAAGVLAAMPGGNLVDVGRAAAGEVGAITTAVLVGGILIWDVGLVLRHTAEMTVSAVYPHTPQTISTMLLVLGALSGAFGGSAGIVRLVRTFLPIFLLSLVVIIAGTLGWGRLRYLLPLWGVGLGRLPLRAVFPAHLYTPALVMLIIAGDLQDRRNLTKALAIALFSSGLLMAAIAAILVMIFPYPLARFITFPLHEMARVVQGGRYFERMDGLWVLAWVYGTICYLTALLYGASRLYADAFDLKSHRQAVLPLGLVAMTIALFPKDQVQATTWPITASPVSVSVGLGLPCVLGTVAFLRRRLGRGAG